MTAQLLELDGGLRALALAIYPELIEEQQIHVVEAIREFYHLRIG